MKIKMKIIQRIIQHPTVLVLVDQAISSGSSFLITLVLAKNMDLTNFGLFSSLLLLTFLTMSISNALLIQPFQVTVAKVIQKREYHVAIFLGLMVLLLIVILSAKLLVLFLPKSLLDFIPTHAFLCFLCGYLINDFF
jgi:O-antigen/teichoic acid export membrane protein